MTESLRFQELETLIERISARISEMSIRESMTHDPFYDATLKNMIQEYKTINKSMKVS